MDMSDVIKYPLSAAIELCEQLDNDETNYRLKMLEYKRERDEARIDAQKSKAYKRVLKETNLRQTERIRYLEGATNHASGTPLSVALRERDEAREKAERYRIEANAIMMQRDEWAAMCGRYKQERDEAREEIKRLKVILDLIKKDTI
jgi:uncharacterized coiled-coil DUF342 family protein